MAAQIVMAATNDHRLVGHECEDDKMTMASSQGVPAFYMVMLHIWALTKI